MKESLVNIYFKKRKDNLYDYSKYITDLIFIKSNQLWKSKKEFNVFAKDLINIYYENELSTATNLQFSFNYLNNIICEYFKNKNSIEYVNILKKEIFLLTTILYLSIYIDNIVTPWNERKPDYNEIIEQTLVKISYSNPFITFKMKKAIIKEFVKKIKNNEKNETMFFEVLEKECFNTFTPYDNNIYMVNFKNTLPELINFKEKFVAKTFEDKKIDYDYTDISLELLSITILKQVFLDKKNKYIIRIPKQYFTLKNNLNSLFKNYSVNKIKQYLILLIEEPSSKEAKTFNEIVNNGFLVGFESNDKSYIVVRNLDGEYKIKSNVILGEELNIEYKIEDVLFNKINTKEEM